MTGSLRDSSDATVKACLERALTETQQAGPEITYLRRQPFAYETSSAMDELVVGVGNTAELRVLVKDLGPGGLSPAASAIKPAWLLEPRRELVIYRDLLPQFGLSAPRYLGHAVDEELGRWWLFLELVDGEVLTDVGEIDVWRQVAAWIADMPEFAELPRSEATDGVLVRRDAAWHRHWISRALDASSRDAASAAAALNERLGAAGERLVELLDGLPTVFAHGELYGSNVLIGSSDGGAVRVLPVDWELAGSGPLGFDLAALTSGWDEQARLAMCEAYRDALSPPRRARLSVAQLGEAVDLCRLALAIQWIGWADSWSPPEEHRHDWIDEAMTLLELVDAR